MKDDYTLNRSHKTSTSSSATSGCGCFGCLSFILFVFVVWALIYGVTIEGQHYGVSCSTEHGVEFGAHGE